MYQEQIQLEQNVAMPPRKTIAKDRYGIIDDMKNGDSFFIKVNNGNRADTTAYRAGLLAYAATKKHTIATRTLDGGYRVWMIERSD